MGDTFIPFVGMRTGGEPGAGQVAEGLMRMDGVVDLFPMPGAPPLALEKWPADNHNLGGGGSNAGHFSKSVRSGGPPICVTATF